MKPLVHVREAALADAPVIARLSIRESARHIRADCSAAGFRELLATLAARAVETRLRDGDFRYWVAEDEAGVCGICALRETAHLYHLFVASDRHGRGIGRRLWETARDDSLARRPSLETFTVNASTFAVPVYARLGFRRDGGEWIRNGIRSWPMSLRVR
ncbi:MAG TPA: GNAT family N-acetyltransferase [Gammaproteobacteria bacterium]